MKKEVKAVMRLFGIVWFALVLAFAFSFSTTANPKYAKETGKKCLDCHKKLPKQGDKDPQLTELGQKFKENGHKLPQ
jgi:hypothetical protein